MVHQKAKALFDRHAPVVMFLILSSMLITLIISAEYALRLLGYEYTSRPNTLVLENSFRVQDRGLFVANPSAKQHIGLGVNSDGFRSPEFARGSDGQTATVVMLGDSFTWGASASPMSESFPDVLRNAGYRVHNLGIPGLGPRQYRRIADEYLPRLKPNVVVVALYLGNDFLDAEWEPPPGRPPYVVLEGGEWIPTLDEHGNYIESVDVAYEHFHNKFGRAHRLLRETAVGTLVIKSYRRVTAWMYTRNYAVFSHAWAQVSSPHSSNGAEAANRPPAAGDDDLLRRYAGTYEALAHIRVLSSQIGAKYYTLVIPALGAGCLTSAEFGLDRHKKILDAFQPVYLDVTMDNYFPMPDCHFNNAGHLRVAQRLQKLLAAL
ncbi:MAG TPA: hypothetical protein VJR03_11160 [Nitrospira sp.]|nr:hypothetical protein [Nitrospira sp.]